MSTKKQIKIPEELTPAQKAKAMEIILIAHQLNQEAKMKKSTTSNPKEDNQ